jgi:AraC-like DNA-binding protein
MVDRDTKLGEAPRAIAQRASFAEQTSNIDEPAPPIGVRLRALAIDDELKWCEPVPTVLLPVQQGMVEVRIDSSAMLLDRASWLAVPGGLSVVASAKSPSAALLVLLLHPEARERTKHTYGSELDADLLERFLSSPRLLPRTTWVHEICHRYLFERAVCHKPTSIASQFLEIEIVKELYFNCRDRENDLERTSHLRSRPPIVERAIQHIEAHLFDPISIAHLAEVCGASASTLLRTFKKEIGASPSAYVRQRRLEEAVLFLKSGRYSVSQVAMLVGYDNLAAFSHAFRARFGQSPSELRAAAR